MKRGVYGRKVKAGSSKAWFDDHDVIGDTDLNYEGKNMESKDGKEKVKINKILVTSSSLFHIQCTIVL